MSLKFLNEGFEVSNFNSLKENLVREIKSILSNINEATMSDEDRWDSAHLRSILKKAEDASYDKRKALKWDDFDLDIANKYNLTLPQKVTKRDGSKEIEPIKDNDVDYERGYGRNKDSRSLARDIKQTTGLLNRNANLADYIRKRKEKGPAQDRPYRHADKFATADDTETFGDTTFTHDVSGRFTQNEYDKKAGRAGSLSNPSWGPDSDLTDVEKDRVRVNKQMSQPVRDMKAALKDRKSSQKKLDDVNLEYSNNVRRARERFDDEMRYAEQEKERSSAQGRKGIEDATGRINKLLRKEALAKAIKEHLDSINEAEMSDEDKHDTEILKQIYQKTQSRANAALTPEEKEVLKKYNLERVSWDKNIRPVDGVYRNDIFNKNEFDRRYDYNRGRRIPPKADKINYADRARKRPERDSLQYDMRDRDYFNYSTPDYESEHSTERRFGPRTFQQAERRSENQKMTQNVRDMKVALADKKFGQEKLDTADARLQSELDKLKADYDKRLADLTRSHEWRTKSSRRDVDVANRRINKLLKREEEE